MTPKQPSPYANVGMPSRDGERTSVESNQEREFAPMDQALMYASQLANQNAELMRRLA